MEHYRLTKNMCFKSKHLFCLFSNWIKDTNLEVHTTWQMQPGNMHGELDIGSQTRTSIGVMYAQ